MSKSKSVKFVIRIPIVCSVFLFALAGTSQLMADQVNLSYVDANASVQTLVLDCNTSRENLALATSLISQQSAVIENNRNAGCGSLPDIAASVAAQAPLFAPDVAEAFASASYYDSENIVNAINKVPGVNTVAVQSAVNLEFGHSVANQQAGVDKNELSASLETRRERRASRN